MSLVIHPKYIEDLESFEWDKKWRAVSICKEKRTSGEFYFAQIVRFYGEDKERDDIDISEESKDFAWLGRIVDAVGKRVFSTDPEKPGVREYEPPQWEEIENQVTKVKTKILVKGKRIWKYTIPVNEENTKKMKSLVGQTGLNQITVFKMIKGTTYPMSLDEKTFFTTSVDDIMNKHFEKLSKQNTNKL